MERDTLHADLHQPESWSATIVAALYFLLAGLILVKSDIPRTWPVPGGLSGLDTYFLFGLLAPAIGFAAGWMQGFPRWSYAYAGGLLAYSLDLTNTTTPLVYNFFTNYDGGWGWRAWIPALLAVAAGLLLTRSLRPAKAFFTNIRRDWTLATFAMFAWMPLIITIAFDEIDRLYSLVFKLLLTVVMTAVVVWYMRARRHESRPTILASGILSTLVLTEIGMIAYWLPVGGVYVPAAILYGLLILGFMLSPALLARTQPSGGNRAQA